MTQETDPTQDTNIPENEDDVFYDVVKDMPDTKPFEAPKPCLGVKALPQYKKMGVDITEEDFARIVAAFENEITHHDFENADSDKTLVEQSVLMDMAFRYYFGGGQSGLINDKDFFLAAKAQRQSMTTIELFRRCRRHKRKDEIHYERHQWDTHKKTEKAFRY